MVKFEELSGLERVYQPSFEEVFRNEYYLKGKWAEEVFGNANHIVLELGCGKGEYTTGLAKKYPDKNFIGVDIKGARLWRGAKTANEENIYNAAFLRTRIEMITSFFAKNEVSEIWLTFPDPQSTRRRTRKRLSGPLFLNRYRNFLKEGGQIHLKTDSTILYNYTRELAEFNQLTIKIDTKDLYKTHPDHEVAQIQTFYEDQFLARNVPIKYLEFYLSHNKEILELPEDE